MRSWTKSFNLIKGERFSRLTAVSLGAVVTGYLIGRYAGSPWIYGLLALIGGLVLLYSPFIGLLALLALIPGEELTAFIAGRTFVWVLGVATFGAWLLQVLVFGKRVKLAALPTALVFLWFLWGLASTLWASEQGLALGRSIDLAQGLAFLILLQNLIKNDQRLKIVLFTYFTATVLFSLIAIGVGMSEDLKRIVLTEAQNPNALARALGIGLLLAPYVFSQLRRVRWKTLVVLGSASLMLAIFMTGSRGAWLSLTAAAGLAWLISRWNFIKIKSLIAVAALLVMGILVLNNYGLISRAVLQRALTLATSEQTLESARVSIWRVGWEMVKANPVIGVGLQNFPSQFEEYIEAAGVAGERGIYPGRDPHSIFLSLLAELGIPGLMVFIVLLGAIFKRLLQYKDDRRGICGILVLLFMIFSGMPATIQYRKFFWLALGLAVLIPMVIRDEKNSRTRSIPHVS